MLFDKVRSSLRLKLVLVSVAVEVLMLGLLLGNSLRLVNQTIDEQTRQRIDAITPLLDAALSVPLFERDYVTLMELLRELHRSSLQGFEYVAVLDDHAKPYAWVGDFDVSDPPALDDGVKGGLSDLVLDGASPLTVAGQRVGEVRYGLSVSSFVAAKEKIFEQGLLIAATEVVLTIVLLGSLGFFLTRHLRVLLRGTHAITGGNYDINVALSSSDEIGVLANEFNIMAEAVRDRVAALHRSERALARSKAEFESIFDSIADSVVFVDVNRSCVMVNPAVKTLFGYEPGALLGKTLEFLYLNREDYDIQGRMRYRADASDRLDTFEVAFRRKDGSGFIGETLVSKVRDDEGRLIGYVSIVRDVTERKEAEEALIEQKERAQVTLESIGDAVITTDAKGVVDYINPVAEDLTGWRVDEAVGQPLPKVFKIFNELTRMPVENPVDRCLRENRVIGLANHTVLVHRDGREFAIEDSAAPIRNRSGAILGIVLVFHDVSKARRMAQQLSWQASHDSLTGLVNRREFENRLENALEDARREGSLHALLYLDLDQFKVVNDTCGHVAGDELLRQLSELLKERVRDADTLARLGGDEFGVLLENCDQEQALRVANGIRQFLEGYRFAWEDKSFSMGVSIGLVPVTAGSESITAVLSAADVACYAAKDGGRNRVHVYKPDDSELAKRHGEMRWVSQINRALEQARFRLYCQPIVPVGDRGSRETHYEVLLRMRDEGGTLITPMSFIPAAERYNLMPTLDRWVVSAVFEGLAGKPMRPDCLVAINLSGHSLGDDGFLDFVVQALRGAGVPPQRICFEITETAAIANLSRAMLFIARLKGMGCRFSLDDFGSGLSSFNYLKNLPVDFLKIDGSFVKDMMGDPIDRAMVEAINQIGHVMGIKTIAEFVENEQILAGLAVIGVDYAQGYGIARPLPFDQI